MVVAVLVPGGAVFAPLYVEGADAPEQDLLPLARLFLGLVEGGAR